MNTLLEDLLSDDKLMNSRNTAERVYSDEPILMTAAQMRSYTSPQYRAMRKLAGRCDTYLFSDARLFCQQGRMMADFTDDFDYRGEFNRHFPTYQSMSDLQLRGYFSWRTRLRQGELTKTSLSFAYVYIYELLNGIGVETPQEGFDTLRRFWTDYRRLDTGIDRYMRDWLHDYVVYYGLNKKLLRDLTDTAFEEALACLLSPAEADDEALFAALCTLSAHDLPLSRFYKRYTADVCALSCRIVRRYAAHYERQFRLNITEKWFGKTFAAPCKLFHAAVFYDERQYTDYNYTINPIHRYTCKNGNWSCERYYGAHTKSRDLGALLKTVDARMREKYKFSTHIRPGITSKQLLQLIDDEIDAYLAEKREREKPKIELDLSKLQDIRRTALETQDKLLPEAEAEDEPPAPPPACGDTILGDTEHRLLCALLRGESYDALLRETGAMLSVLCERINEAFFDRFGDTVLVWENDTPVLLEDYREELVAGSW